MFANILNGKILAEEIIHQTSLTINNRKLLGINPPTIAVILIGDHPPSRIYVKNKLLACEKVGINCKYLSLDQKITQQELLDLINILNIDPKINSILVQLPLPGHIDLKTIFTAIDPNKDVDGFNPKNLGLLAQGWPILQPCTPLGIMKLLATIDLKLRGKSAVVVGASNIVGKPMGLCLINAGCTVTTCNSNTQNLATIVNNADLLISATGVPHLIKGDWIKPGSIIIDVGISKVNNKITGDVDFMIAQKKAAWITKVPGGVGPMTVACLLENILLTQKLQEDLKIK